MSTVSGAPTTTPSRTNRTMPNQMFLRPTSTLANIVFIAVSLLAAAVFTKDDWCARYCPVAAPSASDQERNGDDRDQGQEEHPATTGFLPSFPPVQCRWSSSFCAPSVECSL